jgi:RNA polymerase sigma-70 factor (ECF subfamily)
VAGESLNWPEIPDASLAEMAAGGTERAFEQLLARHRLRILRICLRMLNDKIEAEEAAQDIFVKVYYHLKDYDKAREFIVWCSAIAINECRDRLRKRQRAAKTFRQLSDADKAEINPDNDARDDSRKRLLLAEAALARLPDKLKEVIVLKAYGDYSYEEIAKILRVRLGTVMSRLFRARKKLTDIINRGEIY